MKPTRISTGDRWEDFIEIEGSDGKARIRLHDENGDVRHVLETTNVLRVVNALLMCMYSEADQTDIVHGLWSHAGATEDETLVNETQDMLSRLPPEEL